MKFLRTLLWGSIFFSLTASAAKLERNALQKSAPHLARLKTSETHDVALTPETHFGKLVTEIEKSTDVIVQAAFTRELVAEAGRNPLALEALTHLILFAGRSLANPAQRVLVDAVSTSSLPFESRSTILAALLSSPEVESSGRSLAIQLATQIVHGPLVVMLSIPGNRIGFAALPPHALTDLENSLWRALKTTGGQVTDEWRQVMSDLLVSQEFRTEAGADLKQQITRLINNSAVTDDEQALFALLTPVAEVVQTSVPLSNAFLQAFFDRLSPALAQLTPRTRKLPFGLDAFIGLTKNFFGIQENARAFLTRIAEPGKLQPHLRQEVLGALNETQAHFIQKFRTASGENIIHCRELLLPAFPPKPRLN